MSTEFPAAGQLRFLPGVSRTFALTIPKLPATLSGVVANAYLLCRIVDTIEDDPTMPLPKKRHFANQFIAVLHGDEEPLRFAADLVPVLSPQIPREERELISATDQVVGYTRTLTTDQQIAMRRCVSLMADGMIDFQACSSTSGLPDLATLNRYCYHVAGVVGEMLNRLFVLHSPEIARRDGSLSARAFSLGQALQMTNIVKDLRTDLSRGVCWLPRSVFRKHGFDLEELESGRRPPTGFETGLHELLNVSCDHLRRGLEYCALLPKTEKGIRTFCLWPMAMSLLTLRKIRKDPDFYTRRGVKISRQSVKISGFLCETLSSHDRLLAYLFHRLGGATHGTR